MQDSETIAYPGGEGGSSVDWKLSCELFSPTHPQNPVCPASSKSVLIGSNQS